METRISLKDRLIDQGLRRLNYEMRMSLVNYKFLLRYREHKATNDYRLDYSSLPSLGIN